MRYLLGKASLSICLLISFSLPAKDKNTYEKKMQGEGSEYVPGSLHTGQNDSHSFPKNGKGERVSYSLFYMEDRYGIEDGRNIFNDTYKKYGTLLASLDQYFYKKNHQFGMGIGDGYGI